MILFSLTVVAVLLTILVATIGAWDHNERKITREEEAWRNREMDYHASNVIIDTRIPDTVEELLTKIDGGRE